MFSVTGTQIYNNANIEGTTFEDLTDQVEQIAFDTQAITYNQVTDTTNIDSSLNVVGNINVNNDIVIWDKGTPTPYYYRLTTSPDRHLKLTYRNQNNITYELFDCSFNSITQDSELFFKRRTYFSSRSLHTADVFIDNGTRIYFGDLDGGTSGFITYTQANKYLTIESGVNTSNMRLTTRTAAGVAVSIDITPTVVTIPQTLSIPSYTNVTTSLNTLFTRTTNQSWTSNSTSFAVDNLSVGTTSGTSTPVIIWGSQYQPFVKGAVMLTPRQFTATSVPMGFCNVFDQWYDLGCNVTNVGNRDPNKQGVQFRFDSRTGQKVFQIQTQEAVSGTVRVAFAALSNGICEVERQLDLLSNANLTQAGTGIISQAGTGTNAMKAITMNINTNILQNGTGIINQFNTNTTNNILRNTDISGNLVVRTSNASPTTANTLIVKDNANDKGIVFNPHISSLGLNDTNQAGDACITAGTSAINNQALNLTTWSSTPVGVRIAPTQMTLTYGDGTSQRSKYEENVLNECNILSYLCGTTILQSTYNMGNATNTAVIPVGNGYHFFTAIQLIQNQTYTGVAFYVETAGNWNVALYGTGNQAPRLAISNVVATVALNWNFFPFTTPYTATTTQIAYIATRTTSAGQSALYLPFNTYLNYGFNVMTNGTLNKRAQYTADVNDFPANIAAGQVMLLQSQLGHQVLY